jgi:hypothetical protein
VKNFQHSSVFEVSVEAQMHAEAQTETHPTHLEVVETVELVVDGDVV